jgi:hypothetical protein
VRVVPPATDPEAELARLRRPTGPWLHLLDAAPADARQLGWMLGQDGVVVRILRGHCGRSRYGLLDEIGAALQLPGDPAEDWPALGALLTDMAWLPGAGHVLVVTRAALLLAAEPAEELRGFVDAVRDVARGRAEEGDPLPFHVVLQDDAVGVATLRRRLDAVAARHSDLSGWDAEEPVAEVVAGGRSVLAAGDPRPDQVDLAAGAAVSEMDGVVSLGRAWEDFRGGTGAVRVYAPVLTEPRRATSVASVIAGAAAERGASCVVVAVHRDAALNDARQAAVAAAGTVVWPVPAPAVVTGPAAADEDRPPDRGTGGRSTGATGAAPGDEGAGTGATGDEADLDGAAATRTEAGSAAAAAAVTGAGAGGATAGAAADGRASAAARVDPPAADQQEAGTVAGGADRPGDVPGRDFELVAADLQWHFDPGDPEPDAADAAVVAHARSSGQVTALYRTWVRDPDGGWVRVVLGYVGPRGSIAAVERERTAVVDALQRAGAARCCVEVLAASDAGDAHRWLEQRCRLLYRSGAPAAAEPTADVPLSAGPADEDPQVAPLVAWAAGQPAVVALVTAWAGEDGDRTLLVGVAVDATAEPDPIRTAAQQHAPDARVEVFAPARRLSPLQLRLTRSGTRVWQRRSERPAAPPRPASTGELSRPDAPTVVDLGPVAVRDTDEPRGDVELAGFTLVGIDRQTSIAKGAPTADERDTAVIAWAQAEPAAIALLRAVASVDEDTIPVYCACVTPEADPEAVRRELAAAIAATGTTRAAAEAFAPAAAISAFHLDLAVGSTRLWPVTGQGTS